MKTMLTIVIMLMVSSSAETNEVKGKPSFFPVEYNRFSNEHMVILPFECQRDVAINWLDEYENALQGLKPTSKIQAYNQQGNSIDGVLGAPVCFPGECRADYVALPIYFDDELKSDKGVGVKDILFVSEYKNFSVRVVNVLQRACLDVSEDHKNPYGFDFETLPTLCSDVISSDGILGQIINYGWQQQNGWKVFHQFFRPVNNNSDDVYGTPIEISYSTSKQIPLFEFQSEDTKKALLWFERSGIGGVSYFQLRESTVNEFGVMTWHSDYQAGGQPCD